MTTLKQLLNKFKTRKILVIGDLILDQYIRGNVSRISPEAPVPVLLQEGTPFYTLGGAANVANNLSALSVKTALCGYVGADGEGRRLLSELKKRKINTSGIFVSKRIPTSLKTRIIAQHQQVVRVDREQILKRSPSEILEKLKAFLTKDIKNFDAVIISDYGKGLITPELISTIMEQTVKHKKILCVDPKVEHFSYYRGVTAITPNKKETENAIRNIRVTQNVGRRFPVKMDRLETENDIDKAGQALLRFLQLEAILITLGEHGMRLFEKGRKPISIHTRAQEVFDVTGAGDTVIATFTLSLACGARKKEAAELANIAAGVVVGKMGAVPITLSELGAHLKAV